MTRAPYLLPLIVDVVSRFIPGRPPQLQATQVDPLTGKRVRPEKRTNKKKEATTNQIN